MLQGISNGMQSPSLYLTATCKIRQWPRHSLSVAAQPGLVASSSTPETCQHLSREWAGSYGASPLHRPQTHLPSREESKVKCRRTLGSCSLHPFISPPTALGCCISPRCQPRVPGSTQCYLNHSSFLSPGRLNPDKEFISTVEGPWDRRLFRQYKVGRSRQKPCFTADGLSEKERGACKGKVLQVRTEERPVAQPSAQ